MARRTLMLLIESNAETCGRCQRLRYDAFRGLYACSVFGRLETCHANGSVHVARHPDCLKAETFSGG